LKVRGVRWVAVALLIALIPGPALAAAATAPPFIAPVEGKVTKPFKLLKNEFAAGSHRGIDYGVPVGTPVKASGAGTVTHAGPVGDDGLFITIAHERGLETTYSYLSEIAVEEGQQVAQGEVIGSSGEGHPGEGSPALHFGAKKDGKYIDPLLLLQDYRDITELIRMVPLQETSRSEPVFRSGNSETGSPNFGLPPVAPPVNSGHGRTRFTGPAIQPPVLRTGDSPVGSPTLEGPEAPSISWPDPSQPADIKVIPAWQNLGASSVATGTPGIVAPKLNPPSFEQPTPPALGPLGDVSFDPSGSSSHDLTIPTTASPTEVARWWKGLSEAEKAALIDQHPELIGKLVGIDAASRDKANRLRLKRELEHLLRERDRVKEELDRLDSDASVVDRANPFFWTKRKALLEELDGLNRRYVGASQLTEQLASVAAPADDGLEPDDVLLLDYDTKFANGDGKAVVALGNPDTADHVSIVVPGVGSRLEVVKGPIRNAADLRSTVHRHLSSAGNTSVIAWLGYDAPRSAPDGQGFAEARRGASALKRFVNDLRASSRAHGRWQHITIFGHSYGSAVTGTAGRLGTDVQDLVLFASPGSGGMNGRVIGGDRLQIWAARTHDDEIRFSLPFAALGDDPTNDNFGSSLVRLDPTQKGHSAAAYYQPDSTGILNFARIATGKYADVSLEEE
jgi:hypothetical protein